MNGDTAWACPKYLNHHFYAVVKRHGEWMCRVCGLKAVEVER